MSLSNDRMEADAFAIASTPIQMVLTSIVLAADDTNLFTFRRLHGGPLPPGEPGAHIGLLLPAGMERQYSLVDPGATPDAYVVGVKRDGAGRGGSKYLHDELRVGATLSILPPRNNFPLVEDAGHVTLVAGGIGITPIYSMVRRLIALNRSWSLYYCCRSRRDAAFLSELSGLSGVEFFFDNENPGRLPPIDKIVAEAPEDAHLYCCGPGPMLAAFETATAGRRPDHVHVEYFTPRFEAATAGGFVVELKRSGLELKIPPGASILHVVRAAGVEVASSCEEGVCGACETKVLAGAPDHRDAILSDQEKLESATMMICCSGCKGERLVLDL